MRSGLVVGLGFLLLSCSAPQAPLEPEAVSPPPLPPPEVVVVPEPPRYSLPELPPRAESPILEQGVDEQHPEIQRAATLRRGDGAEEAREILARVRARSLETGETRVAAWALHRLGDHRLDAGRSDEARGAYEQALAEHLKNGDLTLAGRAANDLGLSFDLGSKSTPAQLTLAAGWYGRAAKHYAAGEYLHGRRRSLTNKGRMHLQLEELEQAIESWSEASVVVRLLGQPGAERVVQANLSLAWLLRAEGGFGRNKDVVVDEAAEEMARAHFALAAEAAMLSGKSPWSVCEAWGDREDRCQRIGEPALFPPIPAGPPDPTGIRGRITERRYQEQLTEIRVHRRAPPLAFEDLPCGAQAKSVFAKIGACFCQEGRAALIERIRSARPGEAVARVMARRNGLFEVKGLEAGGHYDVVALDDDLRIDVARDVEAGNQQLELGRARTEPIELRVFDLVGEPLAGARVVFTRDEPGTTWVRSTDEQGRILLPSLAEDTYALVASDGDTLGWTRLRPGRRRVAGWGYAGRVHSLQATDPSSPCSP